MIFKKFKNVDKFYFIFFFNLIFQSQVLIEFFLFKSFWSFCSCVAIWLSFWVTSNSISFSTRLIRLVKISRQFHYTKSILFKMSMIEIKTCRYQINQWWTNEIKNFQKCHEQLQRKRPTQLNRKQNHFIFFSNFDSFFCFFIFFKALLISKLYNTFENIRIRRKKKWTKKKT